MVKGGEKQGTHIQAMTVPERLSGTLPSILRVQKKVTCLADKKTKTEEATIKYNKTITLEHQEVSFSPL